MAKTKKVKGKGELSDRIRKRKANRKIETAQTVRTNPFEIKVNRQKHKVIGKHLTKYDKGIPGISRSKAFKKRQDTLLVEYKNKRKSNRLIDHRIGEKDAAASYEEKMFERFALENKRHHQKAGMFNIDDDDDDDDEFELTHKGESLREIEKFERPVESSDEDEGNEHSGHLKGELVTEGHFGGGVLQKTSSETQEKSWKDRMEEMIAKSKLAKQERQSEKEEVGQMTDMLDDQWRQLHNVVTSNKRKNDEEEPTEKDDFDLAVNELRLESTGNPSDRLKTESEMAKIEKEKLEKLEKERLMRMRGEQVKSKKHQSADDLDDGMDYGMDSDNEFEVMYKDGKLVSTKDDDEESEEESDKDEVGSEGESSESEEGGSDEGSDEESEEEDQYSDLDSAGEEVEGSDAEINAPPAKKKKKSEKSSVDDHIPYTFSVPGSYSALIELLDKYSLTDQHTVIERMRKCTHISLAEENKDLLVKLFGFLLEYFGDISLRVPVPMPLLDKLTVHLYELAQQFPKLTAEHSRHVILERQKLFTIYSQSKNGRGVWPFLDLLMYFKLIATIYPTSDFKHEVVTPTMIFASQIYTTCPVTNHRDVAVGLMLTTIMAEYVSFSKSLMPECVNFLAALLYSAASHTDSSTNKVSASTAVCRANLLRCKGCEAEIRSQEVLPFNLSQVIIRGVGNSIYNTDQFVLTALHTCTVLLNTFVGLYQELPAAAALFSHTKAALDRLDTAIYHESLQAQFSKLTGKLSSLGPKKLEYVCRERKKPKVLRLYEPSIEENFEVGKKKTTDKAVAEKQKLKYQYKKELKSTLRELRKDRQFIADQTIKDRMKRDAERQAKTNQILADLQGQQHDSNMFKKMNRKVKRK